jgi:phage tail tape-measure protein
MATATEIAILFKAQDQATSVMRNIEKSAGGLSSSLANIATSAAGFALGGVAMQAFGAAVGGAKAAVIDFNSQLEQDAIAWTTLLHNADAAQSVMIQLQQFAAQTPFEFLDVERATKRFVAMGFSAKDAIDLLTPVGNAASALGLGAAGIDRISLALGQMSAKTKVSQEEMLQLTEAGVPGRSSRRRRASRFPFCKSSPNKGNSAPKPSSKPSNSSLTSTGATRWRRRASRSPAPSPRSKTN